jgi:hypothetical protein
MVLAILDLVLHCSCLTLTCLSYSGDRFPVSAGTADPTLHMASGHSCAISEAASL